MKIQDYPMKCCGMVQAFGFNSYDVPTTGVRIHEEGTRFQWSERYSTDEDWINYFKQIEEHQLKHRRNLAMITLSEYSQQKAIEIAERLGYKMIQKFWNPNSGFHVRIYTKVLWETPEEYKKYKEESGAYGKDYERNPGAKVWIHPHNRWMEEQVLSELKEREEIDEDTEIPEEGLNAL